MSAAPLTLARYTYGLIGLPVVGFVIGADYVWLYNRIQAIGRAIDL